MLNLEKRLPNFVPRVALRHRLHVTDVAQKFQRARAFVRSVVALLCGSNLNG